MIIENPMKLDHALALKRALTGAGVALLLLSGILLKVGEIESRVYTPIITTSIGGAGGGVFYYLVRDFFFKGHKYTKLISIFCGFCFLVIFWLSLVFALAQVGLWD